MNKINKIIIGILTVTSLTTVLMGLFNSWSGWIVYPAAGVFFTIGNICEDYCKCKCK